MTPSSLTQYLLIVAFVVPGIVYQTVRARYLGEVRQNSDLAAKVLRALAASTLLALLYAIVFADTVAHTLTSTPAQVRKHAEEHGSGYAWWAFILVFAVPAMLGRLVAAWPTARFRLVQLLCRAVNAAPQSKLKRTRKFAERLRDRTSNPQGLRFEATVSAWDWAVNHGGTSNGFVRVQDSAGQWWGGAFGNSSYFSDYPEDPAIYVEVAWTLSATGAFVEPQEGSRGAWIPCKDCRTVQFLQSSNISPA
ncbi:DUF6338 family protein [Nocardioides sp. MH1]|uniref:DUF6338 family protein n=1 Tax=Nocardioides sp. MH1 TaxID=3242490 RepID=UPI003522C055